MDERFHSADAAGPLPAEPNPIGLEPLHGVVQALASIALAMPFLIGGTPTMLVIWFLFDGHFRGFNRLDIILVAICGFLGFLMILISAVFGLSYGVTAVLAARRHNRSAALGVAGVLLNGICLPLWLFIAILWAFAVGSRL